MRAMNLYKANGKYFVIDSGRWRDDLDKADGIMTIDIIGKTYERVISGPYNKKSDIAYIKNFEQ